MNAPLSVGGSMGFLPCGAQVGIESSHSVYLYNVKWNAYALMMMLMRMFVLFLMNEGDLNEANEERWIICLNEMMHTILGLYYELLPCIDLLDMNVWCFCWFQRTV